MKRLDRRSALKVLSLSAAALHLGANPLDLLASQQQDSTSQAPAFLLNQLGYLPGQAKVISVRGGGAASGSFELRSSAGGHTVSRGTLSAPSLDTASGDSLRQASLTGLVDPGEYVLVVGANTSDPFSIGNTVYRDALQTTVRGYTGQRCGCTVDLGNGYHHPACHLDGAYGASSGKSGALPNSGGWHDAGDYGRYVVNSGITCGTLLWAWEMYPAALKTIDLGLPSKANPRLPDYLEEVLWNLNWMLQLQDTDGGVFHKQTSEHFCAFIMPQDDHLVSEVIGTGSAPYKSTCATADLAAVMAIAARCYAAFDATLAQRFRTAAEKAWNWAVAHPDVPFKNPAGIGTGDYGDPRCADELLWASAELWRTTGDPQYEKAFLAGLPADRNTLTLEAPSWATVGSLACWTYAMASHAGDAAVKAVIRRKTLQAAQQLKADAAGNGYGNTLVASNYVWGSNGVAGNQSLLLLINDHLQHDPDSVTAALGNLHYLLGRNCHNISFVTQVGRRPFMHPHHRPSAADGIASPWPGLLSGGPNRHPGDPAARTVPPMPPMRMWIDNQEAYSMNEIAINWNAPLVFLLAAANTLG